MTRDKQAMTPPDRWLLQKERILAWLRVGFAVVAVVVIQFNPARVAKSPTLSYVALGSFLLYSLLVLYLVRRESTDSKSIGLATTTLDLLWVSFIMFSTEASRTPFFAYYFFPVITASFRYGIKGSLTVAFVGVALYGFIRLNFAWENPLAIDLFIVRSIYLVFLAYIFGFLSEFEKKQNQKLLALSKTAGEVATLVERRRIAQELHDGLLQSLATHILRIETCRRHLLESPEELHRELQSMEADTRSSMKAIRQFLTGRETQPFPSGLLLEKLKDDLRFMRDGIGLQVIMETDPEDFSPPEATEHELYYVLREALMNVMRHSQASRVELALNQTETRIQGSIRDDGVGFAQTDAGIGNGLGLKSMKDRVEKLGGELSVESSLGKGTRISFILPLAANSGLVPGSLTERMDAPGSDATISASHPLLIRKSQT
jgi:signal transduction histidine kinase